MFKISSEILANIRAALSPTFESAMAGPQIYYACASCAATCKSLCRGGCKGTCKGGCTRSCMGRRG